MIIKTDWEAWQGTYPPNEKSDFKPDDYDRIKSNIELVFDLAKRKIGNFSIYDTEKLPENYFYRGINYETEESEIKINPGDFDLIELNLESLIIRTGQKSSFEPTRTMQGWGSFRGFYHEFAPSHYDINRWERTIQLLFDTYNEMEDIPLQFLIGEDDKIILSEDKKLIKAERDDI